MKKRNVLVFGLVLCIILAAGLVFAQAEENDMPEKYVTVKTMHGELPDGSSEFYIEVENYGDEIILPENPFENGDSVFKGWEYQFEIYAPGDKVTVAEDTEISAIWLDKDCKGLLALNAELGYWSSIQISVLEGDTDPDSQIYVPSAFEYYYIYDSIDAWFEGWFADAAGNDKKYIEGEEVEINPNELCIIYAVWNKDLSQAYRVDFNINAPADNEFDYSPGHIYVKKGDSFIIRDGMEFEGYKLEGWFDKPEGGTYICTTDYEFTPTEDTVLYAHWKKEGGAPVEDDPSEDPEFAFVDVPEDAYFFNPVKWAVANGITSGTDSTHFSPDMKTTRAQMVTFLWRLAGEPVVNYAMKFADVNPEAYYAEAVRWAVSEKITSGTGETAFSPDDYVTREQLAAFIYRYAQTKGMGYQGLWQFDLPFKDADKINSWADEAMHWCVQNGIINGVSADMIQPQGTATRGQIVTMLYRFAALDETAGE